MAATPFPSRAMTLLRSRTAWPGPGGIYLKLKEPAAVSGPASPSGITQAYHHQIEPPEIEQPPTCAIHNKEMVRMNGKRGAFWSGHEKLDDGSWCPYRPPK